MGRLKRFGMGSSARFDPVFYGFGVFLPVLWIVLMYTYLFDSAVLFR